MLKLLYSVSDSIENLPFMPRTLYDAPNGIPRYANFEYRIITVPLASNLPTKSFRVRDETAQQMFEKPINIDELSESRYLFLFRVFASCFAHVLGELCSTSKILSLLMRFRISTCLIL
jgi:hypothetical protein